MTRVNKASDRGLPYDSGACDERSIMVRGASLFTHLVVAETETRQGWPTRTHPAKNREGPREGALSNLVAGVGFEPTTFRL